MSVFHFSIPRSKGRSTVNAERMNDTPSPVFRQSRTRTFCLFSEDLAFRAPYIPQPTSGDDLQLVQLGRAGYYLQPQLVRIAGWGARLGLTLTLLATVLGGW